MASKHIQFVVACNDTATLEANLLASPDVIVRENIIVQREAPSAGWAYNRALEATREDLVVCVHQDVYLPPQWVAAVKSHVRCLDAAGERWGVLGVFGRDRDGACRGQVYSTGLGAVLGAPSSTPLSVRTLDEMVLILRSGGPLRFDEGLGGFHMYGTDICLQAEAQGLRVFVLPCFAIHNSNGVRRLPWEFWRACRYVQRRHRDRLPVHAPCVTLPRSRVRLAGQQIRHGLCRTVSPPRVGHRVADPVARYEELVAKGRGRLLDDANGHDTSY